jgi:hypothetical protein
MKIMAAILLFSSVVLLSGCGSSSNPNALSSAVNTALDVSVSNACETFRTVIRQITNEELTADQVRGAMKLVRSVLPTGASVDMQSAVADLVTTTSEAPITKMSNALVTASDGTTQFVPFIDATDAMGAACTSAGF